MSMAEALRDAMRVAMDTDPTAFLLGEDIGVSGGFGGGFTVTLGLVRRIRPRPRDGYADLRDRHRRRRRRRGDDRHAPGRGDAVRRFHLLRDGPHREPGREDALHEQRDARGADGDAAAGGLDDARSAARAVHRGTLHEGAGAEGRLPVRAYDAKGMLLASIRDGNPVIFLEHKLLYGAKGGRKEKTSVDSTEDVPVGDYEVPLGAVSVKREGRDVTILANMLMLPPRDAGRRRAVGDARNRGGGDRHAVPAAARHRDPRRIRGENTPCLDR
jgi:pyruvate dehydrogenase E1 component beta subunit